ncbi:I78 family peptidase inhibitor [Novosphingobium sp.]|uniref:I78 family peptidase inhibitor n=1 Tax=Novosphingobium sp. TaxID=1874826 RepID=UPI003BAC87D7
MTFRFGAAALASLLLCAAPALPLRAQPAPTAPDTCSLALTARFVGARDMAEVRNAVRQVARPHPVRWIGPGQPITLDQNPQRLNVIVDENGRIAVMRCG